MEKVPKILEYQIISECPLNPRFWRILAFDGTWLWNHYGVVSREVIFGEYRLSDDAILEGVSDGDRDGLQVRLSKSEFRKMSDRIQDEKFRYWKLG